MSEETRTLEPSNTLTLENTAPVPAGEPSPGAQRFIMFGDNWLTMQMAMQSALKLPINQGDFDTKYGTFPAVDKQEVQGCLAAMTDMTTLTTRFGNPSLLKAQIAKDGSYLTSETPPAELYGHIIWLALQIQNVASTYHTTFSYLQQVIGPGAGTEQERAENLRSLLTGPGGLASEAATMKTKTDALSALMASFDTDVAANATDMSSYTGSSSKIMADANKLLGQIKSDIKALTEASNKAHDKWRDYTIAAVSASILITVLSFGILAPVGAAVGIGLGVAAAKQMELYHKLLKQIEGKQVEVGQKTLLTSDLQGLNSQMPGLTSAVSGFRQNLGEIQGVWTNIGGNLNYIASNYTDKQLADYSFVNQALKVLDAQTKWQTIAATTSQFTEKSLVSFDTGSSFGSALSQ